jgi:hypothetical protein
MKNRLKEPAHGRHRLAKSAFAALAALGLAGCGVVSTAVVVTSVAVGVATTAVGVAVDGAVLAGKGVVKTGEVIVDAVSGDEEQEKK